MRQQEAGRNIVPGEQYVVAPPTIVSEPEVPLGRFHVMDWIRCAEPDDVATSEETECEITLLTHIEEMLAIAADLQEQGTAQRMSSTDERMHDPDAIRRLRCLAQRPVGSRIQEWDADCRNACVLEFADCPFHDTRSGKDR